MDDEDELTKGNKDSEQDITEQEFVEVTSRNKSKRNMETKLNGKKGEDGRVKTKCSECDKRFSNEMQLQKHLASHIIKVEIKCAMCDFKTKSKTDFMLHMESHNSKKHKSDPIAEKHNKPKVRALICRWYEQGRCKFGDRCWNIHSPSNPTQCKYKERCNVWPFCQYGHYEVCVNYNDCNNQNCFLIHPFLSKTQNNLPPDLNSRINFPNLQRNQGRTAPNKQ